MHFKQFYLGCLAHASYFIESEGEAAVVDPQRDVQQYLDEAESRGCKIKYVIETHLHADFVSGHRELAAKTGAEIVYSHRAGVKFPHRAVRDGDALRVGLVMIKILETPGHTPEGISLLVTDEAAPDAPAKLLTGDTLFIGDVGRPDLAGAVGYTSEQMASMLYDTLHEKILRLDDATEVYPAHGAGSQCGRNISKETSSTIGLQRRTNYALQPMSKEEFVRLMTTDLPVAPAYFSYDAARNREGAPALDALPEPRALTPEEVKNLMAQGYTILDVREAARYGAGHVPDSINIGLKGQFASWAGSLIKPDAKLIIVAEGRAQVDETVMRLARVGLEIVEGFLDGGVEAWERDGFELARTEQISVAELREMIKDGASLQILDVRRPGEYADGHVPQAQSAPLHELDARLAKGDVHIERAQPVAVICAGGYRSGAATSLLERRGYKNILNVAGGTSAWIEAGYETEKAAAASN